MRKMSRMNLTKHPFNWYGESNERGILMRLQYDKYLGKMNGKRISSFYEFRPAYAYVTENGKVSTDLEEGEEVYNDIEDKENELGRINWYLALACNIIAVISAIFTIYLFIVSNSNYKYVAMLTLFSRATAILMAAITKFFLRLVGNDEIKSLCRFHSAEHAAINAYYDLYRTPTMEEIKEYSIFSYYCGVPELVKSAWPWYGLSVCVLFDGLSFLLALWVFIIITFFCHKCNFYFTEIGLLGKPTDLEYEVAIKAMEVVLKNKEEEKENFERVISHTPSLEEIIKIDEENGSNPNKDAYRIVIPKPDEGTDE